MTLAAALLFATLTARARYLMGTVCEVRATSEADITRAFTEADRIESFLSNWRPESELSRVNRGEGKAGDELRELLDVATQWTAKTNRAFDPRWNGKTIDSGAFGKGYALDRMLALIPGDAMIDFGGQIIVRGSMDVAIADPADRQKPIVHFTLTNGSVSTSSNAERGAHIVDPRTGRPIEARGSASAIADDALTADILSTALYVMGEDEGLRWADANGVAAIFIDAHKHIRMSAAALTRVRNFKTKD
jgi:thiamine biosynthesis lipoprotein